MSDILERIDFILPSLVGDGAWIKDVASIMQAARDEIERLRRSSGETGPSFREIKQAIKEDKSHLWRPESGTSL